MLKRLLLLLAETKASVVAREYAIDLAWHADAGVTGVAGLDLSFIEGDARRHRQRRLQN
jgi:hypothetical protein